VFVLLEKLDESLKSFSSWITPASEDFEGLKSIRLTLYHNRKLISNLWEN
jgi:hypothetical protein